MARMTRLTHERLLQMLGFDPATGVFTWAKAASNRIKVGARAGVIHKPTGGRYITIDGESFMAHRLAWFFVHGEWPANDIRPADGNYDNCAVSNLIETTRVALQHTRGTSAKNTSGHNGVSRGRDDKWQARITWNYKQINLGGSFDTAEEAGAVVESAYSKLRGALPGDNISFVIDDIRLDVRRRSAWKTMQRTFPNHTWASYEEFAAGVANMSERRWALAPVDPAQPIGPNNFRWAVAVDLELRVKDGRSAYNKVMRESNRDLYRDRDFRKKYGISFADYSFMMEAQNGVCAICEKPEIKLEHGKVRLLSVDHDHKTGAVRGLLCGNCNMAIGYACDDVSRLEKAIKYLRDREPKDASGDAAKIMN